jgi:prevent-host-death family protein
MDKTYRKAEFMTALTFRNRQGDLVDIPSIPATRLKNELGAILERAAHGGAVAITRHDAPRAVLISFEEFSALAKLRSPDLAELDAEFDDLLAQMQTPQSRAAVSAAFDAPAAVLGGAAVSALRGGAPKRAARRRPA